MRRLVFTLAASVLVSIPAALSGAAPGGRAYSAGHYGIEIDGKFAGYLESVEGGAVQAEVVEETPSDSSLFAKKHIGNPKYEDFAVQVGMPTEAGLVDWVESFFKNPSQRRSGAIVAANFDFKELTRHTFQDALITEIGFPALDGASKDPAFLKLRISPEKIEVKDGDGSVLPAVQKEKVQKQWHAANFRFSLGDLPTKRVAKIEAFTVKQKVAPDAPGEERLPQIHPSKVEVPNLEVTLSLADVGPWASWAETFIAGGQSSDADEKSGSIEFLDPSLKSVLGRIDMTHVGIVSLRRLTPPGDPDALARFVVELYVEEMHFDIGSK